MFGAGTPTPRPVRYLLAALIVFGFLVRYLRCGEGLPYIHGWDEPQTAGTALRIMTSGDLNPHFFTYGSVTIYLHLLIDIAHFFYLMSQPSTAPSFLTSIADIKTQYDTGWIWTISHPSFYFWNRVLVAVMGTIAIALVYLLARQISGWGAGIVAAALLAGLDIHIQHSALVTPDVPASVFVLATVLLSLLFLERQRPVFLVLALAAAGLAASTKYNAALSIAVPLTAAGLAALSRSPGYRPWLWAAVPLVPAAAFLAGTPYALMDLAYFLKSAGIEVRVYKVLGPIGNPTDTVEPGLRQLSGQLHRMRDNLGWVGSSLSALGVIVLLATRAGGLLLIYPTLHLAFMSSTRVPFHRNFVVLYPFAAVAFGAAVVFALRAARRLAPSRPKIAPAASAAILLLAGGFLAHRLGTAAAAGWTSAHTPESRAVAVGRLAELARARGSREVTVGIEEELRIHGDDLRKLGVPYEVRPYLDLLCHAGEYGLIARAARHSVFFKPSGEAPELLDNPRAAAPFRVLESVGREAVNLDILSADPEVQIVEPQPPGPEGERFCVGDVRPREMKASQPFGLDGRGALFMDSAGSVSGAGFLIPAGSYAFNWRGSGTRARGEIARLRATVTAAGEGGGPAVLGEETVELASYVKEYAIRFELSEDALVVLKLDFNNDYYDPATREDRNVSLETIRLLRIR